MTFSSLPMFAYGLIMADPPWQFENWSRKGEHKNAAAKYDCMPLDDIKAMPVGELAAGDCVLWLWATNPLLREAFDVIDAWGFRYVTAGTWVKTTKTGKLAFGTGYRLRSANEPFLIATNGNPETAKNVRSVIMAEAREHSRKPDEAFSAAEALVPNVRRLELFSRQSREGWDTWGNESTKFDEVAA
ncbi:MAG: DNA methyltransferase [Alteromonadaceae bacterium]|nr:DNA methyltransferase [Alteromonadaceae bacterium]